ncbi:autotransporter outer membrane beta-barrel domain-containing protein [Delftia acidovorans]|uniref:autotransporter outer membrane beta-barrel domain-containing protein n=1 Tax=Delftia acidovorans TaxID=80866 RepID=UPI0022B8C8B7|nr:autotransporter outer membrane beta-barrel domain-containing protein [Delftia acidovorans]
MSSALPTGTANYRGETTLYSAAPGQALRYERTLLVSLHQRRGAHADLVLDSEHSSWARTLVQREQSTANGQRSTLSAAQFGVDFLAIAQGAHSTRLAGYAAYGTSHGVAAHIDPQQRRAPAGGNRLNAYSLGLTGTWRDGQGGYLDAVLQATHFQLASRSRAGMRLNTRGYGLAASLEAGQRLQLAEYLDWQPQAQLIHQRLALGQSADDAGRVRFAPSQSTQLRLGGRLNHSLRAHSAAPATAWLGLHLQRQLGSPGATDFATPTEGAVRFASERPRGTWRAEVGVEGRVHPNLLLNGGLAAEQSLGGPSWRSLSGQVGVTWRF